MKPLNLKQWVIKHPEQKDLIAVFDEASRTVREQYVNGNQKQNIVSLDISNGKNDNGIFYLYLTSELKTPIIRIRTDFDRPILAINNCIRINLEEVTNVAVETHTINETNYYWRNSHIKFTAYNIDYMATLTIRKDNRKTA